MKSPLLLPGLAFLLGCLSVSALAQDLQSLDELVKAAGCTPVIDGGTGGTGSTAQYHSSYGPEKAFDGITYSTDHTTRWLGSIQNGTYLLYALPEEYSSPFQLQAYRVHTLSCGPVLTGVICVVLAAACYLPTQRTIAWRLFVFGKGLKHESQITLYQQGLQHYSSPRFALRLGNAYFNYSLRTKDPARSAQLRSQAHQLAETYLKKYPKEKELSKLYMISLPQ